MPRARFGVSLSWFVVCTVVACSGDASTGTAPKPTPDELAVAGSYNLVLVGGVAPPAETSGGYTGSAAPFGQCDLVIEGGSLALNGDLTYTMTRSNHYRCPTGGGRFTDTAPSFVVTGQGKWSYAAGNLSLSQAQNVDFSILLARFNQTGQIAVDVSLVGCSPNNGFVCVPVSDIVFRFGR